MFSNYRSKNEIQPSFLFRNQNSMLKFAMSNKLHWCGYIKLTLNNFKFETNPGFVRPI